MNEPRELVFFTDRDLGHRFPDAEWIGEVSRRGWVEVSRDTRIRYSPLALSVLMKSGARLFVLVGELTATEAAELFLRSRKQVTQLLRKENQPFIAKIRRDGVHMSLRKKEWQKRTAGRRADS